MRYIMVLFLVARVIVACIRVLPWLPGVTYFLVGAWLFYAACIMPFLMHHE